MSGWCLHFQLDNIKISKYINFSTSQKLDFSEKEQKKTEKLVSAYIPQSDRQKASKTWIGKG